MRVLVACEESQEVCKAFRERGHEMIRAGEPIVCEMERGKNRYDQPTHYARYRRQA